MAKAKSFCAACKRKAHWHRDPECPLRGRAPVASGANSNTAPKNVQICNHVQTCYMVQDDDGGKGVSAFEYVEASINDKEDSHYNKEASGRMLAITDTACTKAVAGHDWYEEYGKICDQKGWQVEIVEERDRFKFGAF